MLYLGMQLKTSAQFLLKQAISVIPCPLLLFVLSGDRMWLHAYLYTILLIATTLLNTLCIDSSLKIERSKLQAGTKTWDMFLSLDVAFIGPYATLITAALEHRFSESLQTFGIDSIIGGTLFLMAALLGAWAMHTNTFFSATARLQSDRNQTVVQTGPYRYIRHPGYSAGALSSIATALLLGPKVAMFPAFATALLYILRTALEDAMLRRGLVGYNAYCSTVRYRLVPFIW